jgi:uncharacterized membrane protein
MIGASHPETRRQMPRTLRRHRGALAVAIFSLALGLYRLDWPGFWPDEGYSMLEATGQVNNPPAGTFRPADVWRGNTVPNVVRATARFDSGNGAAYAVLLHWWVDLFGTSNVSVRLPSVAFITGTAVVTYNLVALVSPSGAVATLAGALTAASPMLVRASKIARPNVMGVFCITWATWLLVRWLHESRRPASYWLAALYGVASAVAVCAHYFVAFVLVGHAIFLVGLTVARDQRVWHVYRQAIVACIAMAVIGMLFLTSGVWSGIQTASARERARLVSERQSLAQAEAQGQTATTILATAPNVRQQFRLLVANLFLVRSAAADTPWLASRVTVIGLLGCSIITCAIYIFGLTSGYRSATDDERVLAWLCAAVVIAGLVCVILAATLVMGTIVPFVTRSNLALVPCASILTALTVRGALTWPAMWRLGAVGTLTLQAVLFNGISLRQVFLPRYAEASVRMLSGTQQTAQSITHTYRPGDVVEYERGDDALKVNLYLRNADIVQRIATPVPDRNTGNAVRTIVLRRADGHNQLLWRGWQDNGALLPSMP